MKGTLKDLNMAYVRGRVYSTYVTPRESRLYLTVKDYQQKADENKNIKRNIITVTFYGRDGMKMIENLKKNDFVTVSGVMQNVRDRKTLEWGQECWGKRVKKTESILKNITDGELDGDIYPDDDNTVIIRGKLTSAYVYNKNWISITIKTSLKDEDSKKTYSSYTSMTGYVPDARKLELELKKEGLEVIVVGKIESVQKNNTTTGKPARYENVAIRELKIINNKTANNTVNKDFLEMFKQALEEEIEDSNVNFPSEEPPFTDNSPLETLSDDNENFI